MLDNFEWPKSDGAPDEVIFRNVRNHGCHIVGIPEADPPFGSGMLACCQKGATVVEEDGFLK